jgi:hypothetical protein
VNLPEGSRQILWTAYVSVFEPEEDNHKQCQALLLPITYENDEFHVYVKAEYAKYAAYIIKTRQEIDQDEDVAEQKAMALSILDKPKRTDDRFF